MTPDAPRRRDYFVTLSNNYGKQTEHFDGVNITVNARLQNGLFVQGGLGTGRQVTNDCEIVDELPEMLHTFFGNPTRASSSPRGRSSAASRTTGSARQFQGLAAYTIPKIDVQISGTLQNLPGAVVASNANVGAFGTVRARSFRSVQFNIVAAR